MALTDDPDPTPLDPDHPDTVCLDVRWHRLVVELVARVLDDASNADPNDVELWAALRRLDLLRRPVDEHDDDHVPLLVPLRWAEARAFERALGLALQGCVYDSDTWHRLLYVVAELSEAVAFEGDPA